MIDFPTSHIHILGLFEIHQHAQEGFYLCRLQLALGDAEEPPHLTSPHLTSPHLI
jgi:hypothetical protein